MGIKIVSNLTKYMTFCNLRLIQVETLHHIKVSSKKISVTYLPLLYYNDNQF